MDGWTEDIMLAHLLGVWIEGILDVTLPHHAQVSDSLYCHRTKKIVL